MKIRTIYLFALCGAALLGEKTKAAEVPDNMVWIPSGEFVMGNPFNTFYPITHPTSVSEFYVDKYEVTKELWNQIYGWAIDHGYGFDNSGKSKAANHPVYDINWYDMVKWCNARSEKEGYEPSYYIDSTRTSVYRTGNIDIKNEWVKWDAGYRLPTETEWERAARGGLSGKRYPWGDTISHSQANYYSASVLNYDVSSTRGYHPKFKEEPYPYTSPVGYFAPNDYGLYDVTGNVWELCWDWYSELYNNSSTQKDYPGPNIGNKKSLRGGGFGGDALGSNVGFRNGDGPFPVTYPQVGFRTVLSARASAQTKPALDWRQVIETQPVQPTYGICPVREDIKDSLVVVTHGWNPDVRWLDDMTNAITAYLTARGLKNWQVSAYKWVERATVPIKDGGPITALSNAKEEEGVSLGRYIVSQGFDEVHLIAHSAGAGLIQAASETIKALRSDIVVHLTFLDPFIGLGYEERDSYGKGADWADSYFSQDFWTSGGVFIFTEAALKYAYNVNVTWLDKNRRKVQVNSSTSSGDVSQTCYEVVSSHGWPYQFYTGTVAPNTMLGSEGFGFPLSKEGGNWNFATNQYKVGKNALKVLGSGELSCVPNPSPNSLHIELPRDFSKLPNASVIMNSPNVIIHGIDFELRTASPAWLVASIPITNRVNFISLEAKFTSASGAEGLLSMYSDTNLVGSVDERMTLTGIHEYKFTIPEMAVGGSRILGFRLDAFSAIQSSVTITNVALGFAGIREPFSLSFVGINTTGLPMLQLNGPLGFNYRVETSINLVDWATTVILVNTNGVVRFLASNTNNATARFYRAVAP